MNSMKEILFLKIKNSYMFRPATVLIFRLCIKNQHEENLLIFFMLSPKMATLASRNTQPFQPLKIKFCLELTYEGHLETKERFAIQKYLLIIGKKQNMQVLSHTFTYFSTQSPWTMRHRDTSLLIPSSYQTAAWLFIGSS